MVYATQPRCGLHKALTRGRVAILLGFSCRVLALIICERRQRPICLWTALSINRITTAGFCAVPYPGG